MGEINSDFKMKTAEWRGYVKRALEDIGEAQKEMKEEFKQGQQEIKYRLEKLENRMTGVQVKVGAIGGTVALVVTIVTLLLKHFLFG